MSESHAEMLKSTYLIAASAFTVEIFNYSKTLKKTDSILISIKKAMEEVSDTLELNLSSNNLPLS